MNSQKHTLTGIQRILLVFLTLCLAGCNRTDTETTEMAKTSTKPTSSLEETETGISIGAPEQTSEAESTPAATDTEQESEDADSAEADRKEPPKGWELTLASEDWGLFFREAGKQPAGNASPEDLAWYDAYYLGDSEEKVIYLTFDCGYENGNTEPILAALKKHNIQSTFFVTGAFLETAPDMVKRIVEGGHTVGNHTYNHPDMAAISDLESFQKELDGVADLFHEITGSDISPFYRPPQGKCNAENLKMARELGYATVFWSLAYVDWDQNSQPDRDEALAKLTERIHPGAVVLLHGVSRTNGEILDELLTKWENMGYSFRTLADLTGKSSSPSVRQK